MSEIFDVRQELERTKKYDLIRDNEVTKYGAESLNLAMSNFSHMVLSRLVKENLGEFSFTDESTKTKYEVRVYRNLHGKDNIGGQIKISYYDDQGERQYDEILHWAKYDDGTIKLGVVSSALGKDSLDIKNGSLISSVKDANDFWIHFMKQRFFVLREIEKRTNWKERKRVQEWIDDIF